MKCVIGAKTRQKRQLNIKVPTVFFKLSSKGGKYNALQGVFIAYRGGKTY